MTVTAITSLEQFKEIIGKDQISITYFWAEWCGPCKAMSPLFNKFSEEHTSSDIAFYTVDTEGADDITKEVQVRAMPTFLAHKSGEKIDEVIGAIPAKLHALILKYAPGAPEAPKSSA